MAKSKNSQSASKGTSGSAAKARGNVANGKANADANANNFGPSSKSNGFPSSKGSFQSGVLSPDDKSRAAVVAANAKASSSSGNSNGGAPKERIDKASLVSLNSADLMTSSLEPSNVRPPVKNHASIESIEDTTEEEAVTLTRAREPTMIDVEEEDTSGADDEGR